MKQSEKSQKVNNNSANVLHLLCVLKVGLFACIVLSCITIVSDVSTSLSRCYIRKDLHSSLLMWKGSGLQSAD